jgi:hypothetical protein
MRIGGYRHYSGILAVAGSANDNPQILRGQLLRHCSAATIDRTGAPVTLFPQGARPIGKGQAIRHSEIMRRHSVGVRAIGVRSSFKRLGPDLAQ